MKSIAPPGYHTIKLDIVVPGIEPEVFRWRWRAERRCRKLNDQRLIDTYRFEVHEQLNGRWAVAAMQNQAVKNELNFD
jgi:hypothetical protein